MGTIQGDSAVAAHSGRTDALLHVERRAREPATDPPDG